MYKYNLIVLRDKFIRDKVAYCSADSVRYYADSLEKFYFYLDDFKHIDISNSSADVFCLDIFQDYVIYLRGLNLKNTSINTYFRAVRSFCSWMYKFGYINKNFAISVKNLRDDSDEKIPLSVEEVNKVDACFFEKCGDELTLRNYCIFHLMLDCGLRRNEVVCLRISDIEFNKNYISVLGKGSKRRVVKLPDFLKLELQEYINFYRPCSDSQRVFLKSNGDDISNGVIKMMIQRLKARSGVERLSCHLLRHTFATSYVLGGGNLEFLRLLLGHSDYSVTMNYLHIVQVVQVLQINVYRLDSCFFDFGYKYIA